MYISKQVTCHVKYFDVDLFTVVFYSSHGFVVRVLLRLAPW